MTPTTTFIIEKIVI